MSRIPFGLSHSQSFLLLNQKVQNDFLLNVRGWDKKDLLREDHADALSLILEMSCTAWGRASLLIRVPRALEETSEAASVAPCSCQDQ